MKVLNRKLFRELKTLRTQAFTAAILVICGVSLLVSAWSAYQSLLQAKNQYYRDYRFADIFGELKRAPLALATRISAIPGVDAIDARIVIDGLIDIPGQEEPSVGRFISIPSGSQPALNQVYLRRGRLPQDGAETEVALHEGYAQANRLQLGDQLHVLIQGQREQVRIVGIALSPEHVYALSPAAPLPDDRHFGIMWLSTKQLERLARMPTEFNSIAIGLDKYALPDATIAHIDRLLKPYGGRGAYGRDRQMSNMFVSDEIRQQKASAIYSPAIFLCVAAFLIHVISSRLIATHRGQIATLKAVGYSNSEVSGHYIKLIVLMMLLGAIPGVAVGGALGGLLAKSYEAYFRFPSLDFSLNAYSVFIGITAGIIPGLLGGWTSIRSASRLAPAEAMRPPSPPDFHRGLFGRMGASDKFSALSKMMWRNVLFRPLRLTLSVLGMSIALSVVVMAGAWNDVLDFLMTTQFQRVQREDLSVAFIRPVPTGGIQQLSRMDGVLTVEGYRVVPVRVRYQNHKRELSLTGWPKRGMRQRLDAQLKSIPLPTNGMLLSQFFRDEWGVHAGEKVQVEVLEGEQRTVEITVSGFTEDLVGLNAAMSIEALWRVLGEEPVYNLATVKTDKRKTGSLYVKLKALPVVAAVNLKDAMYRGFQESMGTMIRVSTLILICFALSIALGVIYNSVRVSFSERSWELASLRVMGFGKDAVFRLLLGEVATQVFMCLLPGCIIGYGLTHLIMSTIHAETFGFPVLIRLSTYAKSILVILLALAMSALVVRRMISKLSLAEALKARE